MSAPSFVSGRSGGAVLVAAVTALTMIAAGCTRDREIDGVAGYSLQRTTLADAPGICSVQDDLTWCHNNPGVSFGERPASVDLYFRGEEDDAPLVEILLGISACRPAEVEGVLMSQLGDPDVRHESILRWDGAYAVTIAQLAKDTRACEVNIVSPDDEERIAELMGEAVGAGGAGDEQP